MKPSVRTFSLRTLLIGSTLAAIALAFVGNRMIENRRQERLVDEVLQATEGARDLGRGFENGTVQMIVDGELLSESAARLLVNAKRIRWIAIVGAFDASPDVKNILAEEFICDEPFPVMGMWHRKGCESRPTKREIWSLFMDEKSKRRTKLGP